MTLSKLVRRTHMYMALFLTPWIAGYAISTIAMSHRWIGGPPAFVPEQQQSYDPGFAPDTPPADMARRILADLGFDGAHTVQGPTPDGRLTINRQGLLTPRRIVYSAPQKTLVVERQPFTAGSFLNRLHRRRGYQQPYAADRFMAVVVDAVIVALVLWAATGLLMWWEMRATRTWGYVSVAAGIALFVVLVAAL